MKTLALLVAASLFSCVHLVGETCTSPDAFCSKDQLQLLTCSSAGKLTPIACNGPKHCQELATRQVTCDQSEGALQLEQCLPGNEGRFQCNAARLQSYLECDAGVWTPKDCAQGYVCGKRDGVVGCQLVPAPTLDGGAPDAGVPVQVK